MTAQRIAGTIAAISAASLVALAIVATFLGPALAGTTATAMGPGMMTGGAGMMGGPGMMGGAMGHGMMGPGHMGYGTQGASAPIAGAPTVTVTATEFRVSPTEITLASDRANLALKNDGAVLHDLTIPALGVHVVAGPGQTTTVGLRDIPAGRYDGYCSVAGHAELGMRISVVVQ